MAGDLPQKHHHSDQNQEGVIVRNHLLGLVLLLAGVVQPAMGFDTYAGHMNDAWVYNIGAQRWTELTLPGPRPPVTEFQSAVYDPFHDRMIVLGQLAANLSAYDIWSYDCVSGLWSQIVPPAGSSPIPHCYLNAAHLDSANRRAILVGSLDAVYSLNLDTNAIAKIAGSDWPTSASSFGSFGAYAFDESRQRLLVYGGFDSHGGSIPPTAVEAFWICDTSPAAPGSRWSEVPKGSVWPGPLWEVAATIDPVRDRMVLFGGRSNVSNPVRYSDLTFELDLATNQWTTVTTAQAPSRRGYNGECWDSQRNCAWIYGGIFHESPDYIATFGDLWRLRPSPADWQEALPRGEIPITRRFPAIAYDSLRDRIFLFGGQHIYISDLQAKAEIKLPRNGSTVHGNSVLVMAELTSGTASLVRDVRFQYRTSAFGAGGEPLTPGTWTDIPASDPANHPNPDATAPYFIHWDVTSLGRVRLDLQAIATGVNGIADPVPAISTILVDPAGPDSSSSVGGAEALASAHAVVGSTTDFGAGSRVSSTNVFGRVNGELLTGPADVAVQCRSGSLRSGARAGTGFVFDVSTTPSVAGQSVPLTLVCSYADANGDGIVDGTTIPEAELSLCTLSGSVATPLPGSYVDPVNNTVRGDVVSGGTFEVYQSGPTAVRDWEIYR
jgi:hypothetical protein